MNKIDIFQKCLLAEFTVIYPDWVGLSQIGILFITTLFLVLHFCILLKIIPYDKVWGGRLKSDKEMYRFEIVSIIFSLIIILFILIHANILSVNIPNYIITIGLWLMVVLFSLNTLGNLNSKNKFEKNFFTPITILLTIFSLILALSS